MMNTVHEILERSEFQEAPPVFVDIGASGGLNPAWKGLEKYAVCLAFDPDDREIAVTRRASERYRELHVIKRALTSGEEGPADLYLTKSPACSSLLPPDSDKLSAWEFADRFSVTEKSVVDTVKIGTVLASLKIGCVDWFKTDSQGTDMRLFASLGEKLIERVLVAEFEPGIIDAYRDDDKIWSLMSYMHERGFWMSDMAVKGSVRIRKHLVSGLSSFERKYMVHLLKTSPGWAEISYFNSFSRDAFTKRDYLLGCAIALLKRQYGFALELAAAGNDRFEDMMFENVRKSSLRAVRQSYLNLPAYFPLVRRAIRRWNKTRNE